MSEIKKIHEKKKFEEIYKIILMNTDFNLFRKEFSFEISYELRQKYAGVSFKRKPNGLTRLDKQKTMIHENFNEKKSNIV